jgi:uncharacterized protein GlcG (DUF336 family)
MAEARPIFISSLSTISQSGIIPAAGGIIVLSDGGDIIGAVGVTGDTSDNDERCALVGINRAGFVAQF